MSSSADLVKQAKSGFQQIPPTPRKRTAIVTCMDVRLNPMHIFHGDLGDFHIIRNAGGVVTDDVLRSLIVSTHQFGTTKVNLMMHTECGMLGLDQRTIAADLGPLPFDLRGFADLQEELDRGAAMLRAEPLLNLPGGVATFIYSVTDGTLVSQGKA